MRLLRPPLQYYTPVAESGELNKFHEVELEAVSNADEESDDTKVVAKKIKIDAERRINEE